MKINNKAQMHVEIIISFVIFIGFLLFIFVFINPLAEPSGKRVDIDEVEQIVLGEMSEEIGVLSAIVNTNNDCYSLDEVSEYGINFVEVKDIDRKYTLYFSDVFGGGTRSCASKPGLNFTLGVYYEDKIIFEENIKELKEDYESNYNHLKESLELNSDFAFSFKDFEGNTLSELSVSKDSPAGLERYAKEIPIRIIDGSGKIQDRVINIRAWQT